MADDVVTDGPVDAPAAETPAVETPVAETPAVEETPAPVISNPQNEEVDTPVPVKRTRRSSVAPAPEPTPEPAPAPAPEVGSDVSERTQIEMIMGASLVKAAEEREAARLAQAEQAQ